MEFTSTSHHDPDNDKSLIEIEKIIKKKNTGVED